MGFQFKRFQVKDGRTAMKVGTDGVLLGSWTSVDEVRSVLDIGTGSAIIALMIAQRTESLLTTVTGVEVDRNAWLDARDNVLASPWNNRMKIVCSDFAGIDGRWNLIVSNPPFFSTTLKSPDEARALARHGGCLNYFSLIDFAAQHLTEAGSLAIISDLGPHDSQVIYHAEMNRLKVRREALVYSREGGEPIRIMRQFSRIDGPIERCIITIKEADGIHYSESFINLTKEFYLQF